MSISSYRTSIERIQKDIADLEKHKGQENQKIAKLMGEVSSIRNSINKYTSTSTLQSKNRQIESKTKEIGQGQEKIGDFTKKIANKFSELNRALGYLASAEAQEQKKLETTAKKQRDEELRHMKDITYETERQARLHTQLSDNPIVIDISKLPVQIKVVIFAPAPVDLEPLRLDNEIREITQKVRASEFRDSVKIIPCLATQPLDVLQALNEHEPHIVHFSGHGSVDEIAFVDGEGNTKPVKKEAIVQVMKATKNNIRAVVFNTCLSHEQANAVTQHIDIAIGMGDEINDGAARIFAAQFYSAIGFGCSVRNAFDQGIAALMIENTQEEDIPQIFVREGIDPDSVILVRSVTMPFGLTI